MSIRKFTSDELISYVRRQGRCPNKAVSGSQDADILNMLNEAMMSIIVPVIRRAREEYFVVTRRIALTAGKTRYRIPARAVGQQIRAAYYWDGTQRVPMSFVQREHLHEYDGNDSANVPAFLIEGNTIVLADNFTGSGSLELSYLIRPGQLVLLSEARVIDTIDTATSTINTTAAVPASWETSTQGFDIHSKNSGAELRQFDLTRNSATGTIVIFEEEINGTVYGSDQPEPGDYLCLAGEAVVPALPIEFHVPLAQAAVCSWLEAQGEVELLESAKQTLNDMINNEKSILSARVESHPKKIISRNPLWGGGRAISAWS